MKARTLLIIGLLSCIGALCRAPVFAQLPTLPEIYLHPGPNWLGARVDSVDLVVDATIQSARTANYQHGNVSGSCGFINEATIQESFKGGRSGTIVFASALQLEPQSRYLLFLRSQDEKWYDTWMVYPDQEDPDFTTKVNQAKASCAAGLPRLKVDYHAKPRGSLLFVASRDKRSWFVVAGLTLPDSEAIRITVPQLGEQRQAVEWNALRRQLLDYKPGDAKSIDMPVTLEQANEAMQKYLNRSLREYASKRALIVAINNSQKAWEALLQASCTSLLVVPDSNSQASPLQRCRLELTNLRASELQSLAYAPGWYHSMGGCDDACWAKRRKVETEEIYASLENYADTSVILPKPEVSIEASQKVRDTWAAWTEASCQMVTTRWPDRKLRKSLLDRCHLQAIWTWQELVGYHNDDSEFLLRRGKP